MNKQQINKKLEKELQRELVEAHTFKTAMIFFLITFGLLIMYLASPTPAENKVELLNGNTLRETKASEGYGYNSAIIAKLEDGKEVRIPLKKGLIFKTNKKIEITKVTNKDGLISYQFSRYND